ncbi:MAG: hypothetical protein KAZ26_22000, partial [Caldilineaceae bacterium]|nr:hypothetical protein [Caldilineaceae bacterium]
MLRHFRKWQVVVALLAIFVLSIGLLQAAPADAVVGDGTPASCDANALEAALAGGGDVTFNCGPTPLTIAVNTMVIDTSVRVDGGNLVVLWGEGLRQIFIVNQGASLFLKNITLTDGYWDGNGGAIANYGNLIVQNSAIYNSVAAGEASVGGAIYNQGGTVTLRNSSLTSNRAGQFGGGIASSGGTVDIFNSTLQENSAPNGGGGLWNSNAAVTIEDSHITENSTQSDGQGNFGGALSNVGRMIVRRSTIDYNSSTDGGGIYSQGADSSLWVEDSTVSGNNVTGGGGGLQLGDGTTTIVNSTISGNSAGWFAGGVEVGLVNGSQTFQNVTIFGNSASLGANFYQDEGEHILSPSLRNVIIASPLGDGVNCVFLRADASLGNNLSDDETCNFTAAGDQQATDPLLAPLGDNGGPTLTHLPTQGSPAINAGDNGSCPATDQRGFSRPAENLCDIGSVDTDGAATPATATPTPTVPTPTSTPTVPTPTATPTVPTPTPTPTVPTPTSTAVPTPNTLNYTAYAIEVTQGIQDLYNTVPLIRGKTAWVRAYVRRASGASSPPVSARMRRIVNGAGTGSYVYPANPGGKLAPPTSPNRGQLNDAFYFPVPSEWLNGSTLQVEVEVNPSKYSGGCGIWCIAVWWRDADETSYTDNAVRSPLLNLQVVPTMRLKLYNVVYSRGNTWYKATATQIDEIESWLRRAYPISNLIVYRYETTMPESSIYTSGMDDKGKPTYLLDASKVNQRLDLIRNIDKTYNINFRQQDRYYGVATDASGDFMRGLGGGYISSGPTGPGARWEQDSANYGDWYAGHEIGHTWGRGHPVPAGYVSETNKGCKHSRSDPNYPYPNAVIGGTNQIVWLGGNFWLTFPPDRYYGFDVALRRPVVRGPDWTDVMSYCDNQWLSDYTYNGIRAQMQAEGFMTAAQVMAPAGDFLLIQGQIAPDGNSATLGEILTLPAASQPLPEPGAYSLELRGSGGTLLASHSFTPTLYAEEDTASDGIGFVNLVIPAASGTQTIELRRGGTLLASRTVSAHPPTATLVTPNGGESVGPAGVTVSWQMADEDDDPLTAAILFSPDNGASWQTLQTGITGTTSVDIPYSLLTGTEQGLMRVLVSDGVRTVQDDSDAVFSVDRNAPEVAFLTPAVESSFVVSQTVALSASAYDKEDGQLADAAFAWASDRDGALGTGASLNLDTLSAGQHEISVTATDSDGTSTTVTRTIAIGTDVTAAPNLLAVAPQTVQLVAVVGTTNPVTGTLAIRDANAATGVTLP